MCLPMNYEQTFTLDITEVTKELAKWNSCWWKTYFGTTQNIAAN